MGLFKRNRASPKEEKRDVSDKLKDFITGVDIDSGGGSSSGVNVDEMKSMQTSAVYACVKILAETVASLPLQLFKTEKEEKQKATEHPLYECLYDLTNSEILTVRLKAHWCVAFGLAPSAEDKFSVSRNNDDICTFMGQRVRKNYPQARSCFGTLVS